MFDSRIKHVCFIVLYIFCIIVLVTILTNLQDNIVYCKVKWVIKYTCSLFFNDKDNTRAVSNNVLILNKPYCAIFKTSMRYYGINLWNSISNTLKSCQYVNEFKYLYILINF